MRDNLSIRNVIINGKRTSIRLEREMWDAFDDICRREGISAASLCSLIESRRLSPNRTSAVRAFVVSYFRMSSPEPARRKPRVKPDAGSRGARENFVYPQSVMRVFGLSQG